MRRSALALALFGIDGGLPLDLCTCVVAGASWILVLTSLYVAAQDALPAWVRARGLAILLTVVFGAMSAGSAFWGEIASWKGLSIALFTAAAGVLIVMPLSGRWRLLSGAQPDLSPSLHWSVPKCVIPVRDGQGPVLVNIDYRIDPANRAALLAALDAIGRVRKSDGAFAWGVFEDFGEPGRSGVAITFDEHRALHPNLQQIRRLAAIGAYGERQKALSTKGDPLRRFVRNNVGGS